METVCPHCGKTIALVGAKELSDEFEIGSNHVQHAREKGRFPDPWLALGNRMIYLRSDIEKYQATRDGETVERAVEILKKTLSPEQLDQVLSELKP